MLTRIHAPGRRPLRLGRLGCATLAALILFGMISGWSDFGDQLAKADLGHTANAIVDGWRQTFVDWRFLATFTVIAVFEHRRPARPSGGLFTVGAIHDAMYLVVYFVFHFTVARAYFMLINPAVAPLPNVNLRGSLGGTFAAIVAFVLGDFLFWMSHVIRHRAPALWRVHAVHHSQPALNAFTGMRQHFAEPLIASTIVLVPAALLGIPASQATFLATLTTFGNYIVHANIRTNFGPMRHLLVTPQSHRVHHSIEGEHCDKNFGGMLVVWDRLFGTQVRDFDVYPATGIDDERFPHEHSARPAMLVTAYARQLVYPFRSRRPRTKRNFLQVTRVDTSAYRRSDAVASPLARVGRATLRPSVEEGPEPPALP